MNSNILWYVNLDWKSRSIFTHVFIVVLLPNELKIVLHYSEIWTTNIYDELSHCHSSNLLFFRLVMYMLSCWRHTLWMNLLYIYLDFLQIKKKLGYLKWALNRSYYINAWGFFNLPNDEIVQRNKSKKFALLKAANYYYSHLIDFVLTNYSFLLEKMHLFLCILIVT